MCSKYSNEWSEWVDEWHKINYLDTAKEGRKQKKIVISSLLLSFDKDDGDDDMAITWHLSCKKHKEHLKWEVDENE